VPGDQAEQFTPRVPARPRDGSPNSHTDLRMLMQKPYHTPLALPPILELRLPLYPDRGVLRQP
jgi:hypothetical protein